MKTAIIFTAEEAVHALLDSAVKNGRLPAGDYICDLSIRKDNAGEITVTLGVATDKGAKP